MSFSAEWLALREPVDHRSRNPELASRVRAHFAGRKKISVVDFGCGTGSNLRATFALLPNEQAWTLVDYDPALLTQARIALARWADRATDDGDGVTLLKDGKRLAVAFRRLDLNRDLDAALTPAPDLVTASALFDLISERWIKDFALRLAGSGAAFYTVITYDGKDSFAPAHALDHAVTSAFAQHQRGDKGFGPAAGPDGADALARAFTGAGFDVVEGESPWRLGPADAPLTRQLLEGVAAAVGETGKIAAPALRDWLDFRLARAELADGAMLTGHRDTFAAPR